MGPSSNIDCYVNVALSTMAAATSRLTQRIFSSPDSKATSPLTRSGSSRGPSTSKAGRGWSERFEFVAALDDVERRWAACDPRHRDELRDHDQHFA